MLEFYDGGAWKVLLKAINVLYTRAAPTIDGLIIVTDNERNTLLAGEQP